MCGVNCSCPDNAIVLSADEKTSGQAKERKRRDQPPRVDRSGRREWEYIQHRTASLWASTCAPVRCPLNRSWVATTW